MRSQEMTYEEWLATRYRPIAGGESGGAAVTTGGGGAPDAGGDPDPGAEGGEDPDDNGNGEQGNDQLVGQIADRMQEVLSDFGQTVDQRFTSLEEQTQGANGNGTGDPADPGDAGDQGTDPALPDPVEDPEGYAQAILGNFARDIAREEAAKAAQAVDERIERQNLATETREFLSDYPEYDVHREDATPEEQREAAQRGEALVSEAKRWAQMAGLPEQAAARPAMLELVHLAGQAMEAASGETPPGAGGQGGDVQLERGGGAPRGGSRESAADLAERRRQEIKAAGPRKHPHLQ